MTTNKATRSRAAATVPSPLKIVVETPSNDHASVALATSTHGGSSPVSFNKSVVNSVLFGLVAATSFAYFKSGVAAAGGRSGDAQGPSSFASGLFYSGVALIGNTGVSSLRKVLARHVPPAQQVGVATMLQGLAALFLSLRSGALNSPLPTQFWVAAVASSCLNALVKTLETKAFAESDMSLCAPFLAFDPVMQFIVGTCVIPVTCAYFSLGCAELKSSIPLYHVLSVATIASSAFALGMSAGGGGGGGATKGGDDEKKAAVKMLGPLPVGSWLILFNCFVYGFTFRLDKAAVQAAGKEVYYMYGRLIMAATTLAGSAVASKARGGSTSGDSGGAQTDSALAKFKNPNVLALLLGVCCLDAVYMLSLYKAVSLISPVYVAAIKRGGGVLLSSVIGVTCFGESVSGRAVPILAISAGVVLLCMK